MDDRQEGGAVGPGARPAMAPDPRGGALVATYRRRGSRLTPAQAAAWDRLAERWHVRDPAGPGGADVSAWFGRAAPLVVEIGSGVGETVAAVAASRPELNVLAFEVWRPGVAETFRRLEAVGADNVRTCAADAVWALQQVLGPGSVAELWCFFPDPWPKRRHHKRRMVTPGFAQLAASRLEPGGVWRLATDWPDYATWMHAVLDAEPLLVGGVVPRWARRPVTRFERRAAREGRPVVDLAYRRR